VSFLIRGYKVMATTGVMLFRLLLAAGLGAVIGYQRRRAGKAAGLRTHTLICLGAALFTLASLHGFGGTADSARIAAGIVVGVGFLGAGSIIRREEGQVGGLTSGATIWTMAAVGLAVGAGLYIIAIVAMLIALLVLVMPHDRP
jgi:putative Mg2+ transporter-C (MgtC) family protein